MDIRRFTKCTAALLAAGSLITPSLGQQQQQPPSQQQQEQLQREEVARQAAAKAKQHPIAVFDKTLDPAGIEKGLGSSAARIIPRPGYNADGTRQHGPGPDPDKPKLEGSPPR
jgi:hypothetical protein